ncbi:lysine--tRNA ligase [Patescibacteria group bacterium]|nr:lysine--tRNA ligase [Patescibacteria group bacterium]
MESLDQIIAVRKDKLRRLRDKGVNPYPSTTDRTLPVLGFVERFNALKRSHKSVILAGRLMAKREFGGLTFGLIKDGHGDVQIMFKKDDIGAKAYADLELIDVGDIVQVTGIATLTKKGEKTLLVRKLVLLAKSLRPLPEKWHGLTDQETRFRQRYLDLIFNPAVKERFLIRHHLVQAIREFLLEQGYIEVDTPALQPMPGGALATPFKTRYEAVGADVYLRIAPELYLKRLIVGGFERVFEFARVFRNEGVSTQHLQDFTMLEFYQAYADYRELMKLTEKMLSGVIKKVLGTTKVKFGDKTIDFKTPWPVKSFRELILKETGIDIDKHLTAEKLQAAIRAKKIHLTFAGCAGRGKLIDELYKEKVRPKLVNPMFLVDHPLDLSPLAKQKEGDQTKVQRFQLVVMGMELVNAFSELNDPIDQAERFREQARQKKAGDKEAHSMDSDFVKALEYGMPPTAGWGMGIDRLVALLTNADSIREAVLFPFVKSR